MSVLILSENLWRDGTILAATTEAPQFPPEYTQDDLLQLWWRSTAIAAAQTLDCDLGDALEYDFIGILGHNLAPAATIEVTGADDDAFTTNPVVDTLTYVGNNIWELLPVARTKRYVRLSLTDIDNPSGYLQVATIVLGKSNALNRGPSVPDQRGPQNDTETESAPSGSRFVVQEWSSIEGQVLPFVGLDDVSELIVEALVRECGMHKGFALCLDSTVPNANSYWLYLVSQEKPSRDHMNYWIWTLEAVGVL